MFHERSPDPIWQADEIGALALKISTVATTVTCGVLVAPDLSAETQIGLALGGLVVLLAGLVWRHVEAVRAYERGEW